MNILEDNFNFTLSKYLNGTVLSACFTLVMVTAFVANLFVIIVTFCHRSSLKHPSTIFLTSLLLADLVVVFFVMPFSVIATARSGWIFGQTVDEKNKVCQFAGYMFWYGVLLVTVTLVLVSFDRFLSIVKPLVHKQYMKPHTTIIIIIIAWIICGILNTTPFYGFGKFGYSENQGTCAPEWSGQKFYRLFFLIICVTLIGGIVVTSLWTCCFTRRFLRQHQRDNNIYITKNRRLIGIFGSLLLVCVLCFGPGLLTAIIRTFTPLPYSSAISVFCFYFLTIANPLVQSFFRPDVRDTVKHLFGKCPSCSSSDTIGTQYSTVVL